MISNNQGLNFLSNQARDNLTNMDTIDEVANMIKASGASRGERRRLEKALAKTTKLSNKARAKAQCNLDYSAYEEFREITDLDFVHFNAVLGIVMYEDYHWKEDENQEHGQILSLFERIQAKMRKYKNSGTSTKDICKELENLTGIVLLPDEDFEE